MALIFNSTIFYNIILIFIYFKLLIVSIAYNGSSFPACSNLDENGGLMLEFLTAYVPLLGLLIFGNIENLVLASQGVVAGVKPKRLGLLSILFVIMWLLIGTFGTQIAIQYSDIIEFIGGLAIFVLGIQAMVDSRKDVKEEEEIIDEYGENKNSSGGEFRDFIGLLLLGNIENLILASQSVVDGLNPVIVMILSLLFVIMWLFIGTYGTKIAIKYANHITFIGGLAIFILGLQSMFEAVHILL